MINGAELMKRLLDAMLPNRAAPVLARVLKAHEGSGKTRYSVDVRVVKAGTLEDTEQVISEVPLNPIWAGKKKRGVYAIPGEGQVVIVEFLCWNLAYPFVAGMWADEYEADDFGKDRFIITDGGGMKFEIDAGGRGITLDNGGGCVVKLEEGSKVSLDNGDMALVSGPEGGAGYRPDAENDAGGAVLGQGAWEYAVVYAARRGKHGRDNRVRDRPAKLNPAAGGSACATYMHGSSRLRWTRLK